MGYPNVAMATHWTAYAIAVALACAPPATHDASDGTTAPLPAAAPMRVVATTSIGADLARQVCGDVPGVTVTSLMGPGVDPHIYRPTVRDVRALAGADVVVAHGLLLEGRMEDLWPKLQRRGISVVVLSDAATAGNDPHIWMDASMWAQAARRTGEALAAEIPDRADAIRASAAQVATRWMELDAQVRKAVATIPLKRRMLVTAHDAFGHFGAAYGMDVRGVQGISTEAETGLADLRALVDEVIARDVPAVFHETSVPDRAIDALVESAASRGHALRNAAALHSDALGPPGGGADTYEGMMRSNVRAIVEALGGDASAMSGGTR
jgi:manganese/zinc/iron transport system substrate-binding protein